MSDLSFEICQNHAHKVDLDEGQRCAWCTCGLSLMQPFCDGAHRGTEYKSLKIESDKQQTVYLCGCKNTKNPPYCDGSSNTI